MNILRDLVKCVPGFSFRFDQRLNRFPSRRLSEVSRFAQKEASRGVVMKVIRHKSDLDMINQYRQNLRQALDLFKVSVRHIYDPPLSSCNNRIGYIAEI